MPQRNLAHITIQVEVKEKHGSGGGNKEKFLILQSWGRVGARGGARGRGVWESRSKVLLGNRLGSERFPNQSFKN